MEEETEKGKPAGPRLGGSERVRGRLPFPSSTPLSPSHPLDRSYHRPRPRHLTGPREERSERGKALGFCLVYTM